jgi:hypothetical protein
MRGTYFGSLIKARTTLFEKEYNILRSQKNKILNSEIDFKDFLKSRLFVISKNLSIKNRKGEELSILAPLVDKISITSDLNKVNTKFTYQNSKLFISSVRNINKNEQLFMKSGNFSNADSLLYYGYTVENNRYKAKVYLDVKAKFSKVSSSFNNITNSTETDNNAVSIPLTANFNLNQVLSHFRKLLSSNINIDFNLPADIDLELSSLNLLKKSLKATKDRFASNLKSDLIISKKGNVTKNEENIYRVIIEEKRLVLGYYYMVSIFERIIKNMLKDKITKGKYMRKIAIDKNYKRYYQTIKGILKNMNQNHTEYSVEFDKENDLKIEQIGNITKPADPGQQNSGIIPANPINSNLNNFNNFTASSIINPITKLNQTNSFNQTSKAVPASKVTPPIKATSTVNKTPLRKKSGDDEDDEDDDDLD